MTMTTQAPATFQIAGVMGFPVLHSRSPALHNHWLAQHGITGVYVPVETPRERLGAALRALPGLNYRGVNLTIPLKEDALAHVDRIDPLAKKIGAINCVVVAGDGSLDGYNYDAFGFMESLRGARADWRADAGPALVLGAGGAARAIVAGLLEDGAREIRIANRTLERAQNLAAHMRAAFASDARIEAVNWDAREAACAGVAMLVNTTSMGMKGQPPLALRLGDLPPHALVADIVYTPLETELLKAARARGNPGVDGLGMLIHQARPAFRHWFGVMPDADAELRARIEATL